MAIFADRKRSSIAGRFGRMMACRARYVFVSAEQIIKKKRLPKVDLGLGMQAGNIQGVNVIVSKCRSQVAVDIAAIIK
jgi:hypothetical protein